MAVRAMKERAAFLRAYREAFWTIRNAVGNVLFPNRTWHNTARLNVIEFSVT